MRRAGLLRPRPFHVIVGLVAVGLVVTSSAVFGTDRDEAGKAQPTSPETCATTADAGKVTVRPSEGPAGDGCDRSVRLQPVDGGTDYYGRFSHPLPTAASFFPIGVWFASVVDPSDIALDTEAGINLYVALTEDSRLKMIADAGSYAMTNTQMGNGAESVGWMLADEFDMTGGPGDGPVKGDACQSPDVPCGYTRMEQARASFPKDGRMRYANYGKGVTFWETDAQAARFVNEYQDVVSADNYWFTDRNVCIPSEGGTFFKESELVGGRLPEQLCHRAANYGLTMDRVRELVSPARSKPVWAFVEVGHPSGSDQDDWPTIKPDEIVAAVWSSLIHGARGIIYFNHSFGGPCPSHNVLREPCYAKTRETVTKLNAQLKRLAPVLNAPFAINAVTASPGVDVATKWHGDKYHVLAGSKQHTSQSAEFQLACTGAGTAKVIDEGRTLPVKDGRFTDTFKDGNAVHLYEINVPGCGYSAG